MAQILINQFEGQQSSKSTSEAGIPYRMVSAKNVVFDANGSVRPRPGIQSGRTANVKQVWLYEDSEFTVVGTSPSLLKRDSVTIGTLGSVGTSRAATWSEVYPEFRGGMARNGCFYVTSTSGIKKIDTSASTGWVDAGMPKPLDPAVAVIAAWVAGATYKLGTVVSNSGNYYRCITAGVAAGAGGPTTTASSIADNTVVWAYVSPASTAAAVTGNNKVAYRTVLGYRDGKTNVILSAPSSRAVFTRASGGATTNVYGRAYIPSGPTSSSPVCFLQVYRSIGSGTDATEPSDELYLNYEANLTATDVSNGYVDFIDVTPDALLGPTGYFCASQDGILQSNEQPPYAADLAFFNDYTFYANTETKQRLALSILSVDTALGVRVGDYVTIASTLYTAAASENAATGTFKVTTSGSAAQNIEDTAKSLVRVINAYATNTSIYAYYVSGYQETPGKILLEVRALGAAAFTATAAGNGAAYNPPLPPSAWAAGKAYTINTRVTNGGNLYRVTVEGTSAGAGGPTGTGAAIADNTVTWAYVSAAASATVTSKNDEFFNGLCWSKAGQPEAVPVVNYTRVGSTSPIYKLAATRSALYAFKNDGLWRITGVVAPFTVECIDPTVRIAAPQTVSVFNNEVYFVGAKARVYKVSDYGVVDVSEGVAMELSAACQGYSIPLAFAGQYNTFGLGCDGLGVYLLGVCNASGAGRIWAFDGKRWSEWTVPSGASITGGDVSATAGVVLAFSDGSVGSMGGTALGMQSTTKWSWDLWNNTGTSYLVSSKAAGSIVLNNTPNPQLGSNQGLLLTQDVSLTAYYVFTVTGASGGTMTVTEDTTVVTPGNVAVVAFPIDAQVQFAVSAGSAAVLKQWAECELLMGSREFVSAHVSFASNLSTTDSTSITCAGDMNSTSQAITYNSHAVSTMTSLQRERCVPYRFTIPRAKQVAGEIYVTASFPVALSYFILDGIALHFEPINDEVTR